jgi:hypothetical protein
LKALLALAIGLAALGLSGTAQAQQSCGETVLQDWFDGQIDGVYPAKCYRDALKQMPDDVRTYTSAAEDIGRALSERLRAAPVKRSSAQGDATRSTSGTRRAAPSPARKPAAAQPSSKAQTRQSAAEADGQRVPGSAEVLATAGGDRASATPAPLLALGAGLILLAGGAAVWGGWTVARRRAR